MAEKCEGTERDKVWERLKRNVNQRNKKDSGVKKQICEKIMK